MDSVPDFLKRASDRNGFIRERYEEKKIANDFSNIVIMPFFGDIRSLTIMSSYLLNRYRTEVKNSKYFILASWAGYQGLFPYVDEYWAINDEAYIKRFYEKAEGYRNTSDMNTIYNRNINEFFREVIDPQKVFAYYNNGFTNEFFEKFNTPKRFLPFVPSSSILGKDFNKDLISKPGMKVFLHPSFFANQWQNGRCRNVSVKKEFWISLAEYLLSHNYYPVVWQNYLSHDISQELAGKVTFLAETDIIRVLAAMRSTGCVLDVFNSISKLAIMARCPFIAVDERSRYWNMKDYEIDDLSAYAIPKDYIFTFSTIISEGNLFHWSQDIFQSIVRKLDNFVPMIDRESLPSTGESIEVVPYKTFVRKKENKRIGTRFIKVLRD